MTRIGKQSSRFWTTEAERLAWIQELSRRPLPTRSDKLLDAVCWVIAVGALAMIMLVALSMGPK